MNILSWMVFNHVGVITWDWETGWIVRRVNFDILLIIHFINEKAR